MAYTAYKYEHEMVPASMFVTAANNVNPSGVINGLNLKATYLAALGGAMSIWTPGFVPHYIRGAAVRSLVTTALSGNPVVLTFEADLTTPGTVTTLFQIALPSTNSGHTSIFYAPTYSILIKPGQTVRVQVTTAATALMTAKAMLWLEPVYETPTNVTGMIATT
jgi:hypothetical protein